jgi:hypothetical protein
VPSAGSFRKRTERLRKQRQHFERQAPEEAIADLVAYVAIFYNGSCHRCHCLPGSRFSVIATAILQRCCIKTSH